MWIHNWKIYETHYWGCVPFQLWKYNLYVFHWFVMNEINLSTCRKIGCHSLALTWSCSNRDARTCAFLIWLLFIVTLSLALVLLRYNKKDMPWWTFLYCTNVYQGTWYPVCTEWNFQMAKVVVLVLKRSISDHRSGRIGRLLVFQTIFDWSVEYYMFCDQNDDIDKFYLNMYERIVVVYSFTLKAIRGILKKSVMCLLMSLEEFRSCNKRSVWDGRAASKSERCSL